MVNGCCKRCMKAFSKMNKVIKLQNLNIFIVMFMLSSYESS